MFDIIRSTKPKRRGVKSKSEGQECFPVASPKVRFSLHRKKQDLQGQSGYDEKEPHESVHNHSIEGTATHPVENSAQPGVLP